MTNEGDEAEEDSDREIPPDPAITPEVFAQWRSPRFGTTNPQRMNNALWEWLVRSKLNAYQANKRFVGPSPFKAGPGWCFERFGQTSTILPDGRRILIGGEHEDYYDPDFYIYNDVVALHPEDGMDIWCYPRSDFLPTDFHTATLLGDRIIMIGCAGYKQDRQYGSTLVQILDLKSMSVSRVETFGESPSWLHRHQAALSADGKSIVVKSGVLYPARDSKVLLENIDDWELNLDDWLWKRLTRREWQRWVIMRTDGKYLNLWEMRMLLFYDEAGWMEELQENLQNLREKTGAAPNLETVRRLYRPEIPHEEMPEREDEGSVFRIRIQDTVVRYSEDSRSVVITVEGKLANTVTEPMLDDLRSKIEALENTSCTVTDL